MKKNSLIKKLILKNRSCRRFYGKEKISLKTLKELIELARLSASSANLQPLKYIISSSQEDNQIIFPCLKWAGYLKDWGGPGAGEMPSGYVVVLGDTNISKAFGYDAGIAAQSILLGAVEKGLGGCIIASVERERLRASLKIAGNLEILFVIALGKPGEKAVIEPVGADGSIKYWRDKKGIHHVPKRALKDIVLNTT